MMQLINILITAWILVSTAFVHSAMDPDRKVYIVYMGSLPEGEYSPSLHHTHIIKQVVHPSFANKSLVRSYTRSFNGFAANLTKEEHSKLAGYDAVVSIYPCQKITLQTTRSWDYIGLTQKVKRVPLTESDIIIGVIDTGIWPESESFKDEGYGPIPAKWKGVCHGGKNFSCNRKIIGARTYNIYFDISARDVDGHGTHVASTAAGNTVYGASYYGLARGTARGGVPSARLAVYKICDRECFMTDMLSAFDDAIADGVDVISLSFNYKDQNELTSDPIAVGAFHAMVKGIVTVNSAGNSGPGLSTINTYAPWIITVAASTIDRKIIDKLVLGKDEIVVGTGINAFPSSDEELPLVYGKEVTNRCSETDARNCVAECLESSLIEKKVVLCDHYDRVNIMTVNITGALGCITSDPGTNVSLVMQYPVVALSKNDLNLVRNYKETTKNPVVKILKSEDVDDATSPQVATFSSRGPITFLPDIIKPDVTAPGVEILAAFSPLGPPSGSLWDQKSVNYNILSGTSMACPHVAAAAAYVKSFHPHWSPSAIKSALMTTARTFSDGLNPEAEFSFGSGQIDPTKARDPGLVYDTSVEDYMQIWCNISRTARGLTDTNATTCPSRLNFREINYPSMAARIPDTKHSFSVSFPRHVMNVGPPNSTYVASVHGTDSNLQIRVDPSVLQFSAVNQKKNFEVTVRGKRLKTHPIKRASLVWTDRFHNVRSPIVVYTTSRGKIVATPPSVLYITFFVIMLII